MCDIDIDTGSNFDTGSEVDEISVTEFSDDLELLDSVEDIFSEDLGDLNIDSVDVDSDYKEDCFDEDDLSSLENATLEFLDNLPEIPSHEVLNIEPDDELKNEIEDLEVINLQESELFANEEDFEQADQLNTHNLNIEGIKTVYTEYEKPYTMIDSKANEESIIDGLEFDIMVDTRISQSDELRQNVNDENSLESQDENSEPDLIHEVSETLQNESIKETPSEMLSAEFPENGLNDPYIGPDEKMGQEAISSVEIAIENSGKQIDNMESVPIGMDQKLDDIEGMNETTENDFHESTNLETLSLDELDTEKVDSELETISQFDLSDISSEESQHTLDDIQVERDRLVGLRDELLDLQSHLNDETDDDLNGDTPLVRTLEITPEIQENRERDTEAVLDNYRENLREYCVDEASIEELVEREREKINAEYESLNRGDEYPQMYEIPNDWTNDTSSLMTTDVCGENLSDLSHSLPETVEQLKPNVEGTQELNINYEEIYDDIQQETIEQGFENIHIDADPDALNESIQNFTESYWAELSLNEQKESMSTLADYIVDIVGFKESPQIVYYNNPQIGDFGGYDSFTNTLRINEYMLNNSYEAADTIAHEIWHAHQHECALNPQCARDYQYQYNFENYIPPELGQQAYEAQLIEAEARAFAAQFKDKLDLIGGKSR